MNDARLLEQLDRDERLRLMRFVCSFAWADLRITDEERALVASLIRRLHLDEDEKKQVAQWLEVPPRPDGVDPTAVPAAHREIFRRTMRATVTADHKIAPEEREALALFDLLTE